jgi:RNA-directed DNA polymerase
LRGQVTEEEVKYENVLEKVYEPGRLYSAWQQVRSNAGAAGIDGMTVETFESREDELLLLIHDKLEEGN